MNDSEQLRDIESNEGIEPHVREQRAVRLQLIFCAIAVVAGPVAILAGAWGTPRVSLFAAIIGLVLLIRGYFAWVEYKKITRAIHSIAESDRISDCHSNN